SPLAGGILQGRQAVLGANHRSGNIPVMIVASDGLANARLNGQWTGLSASAFSSPTCNNGAEQDALAQANIAKGDTNGDGVADVIIYAVAVGNDFNNALLQAIATRDTNGGRPHYIRAESGTPMQHTY